MSVDILLRAACAAALVAMLFAGDRLVHAQTTASYGTVDPADYVPPAGSVPDTVTLQNTWQTDPFSVDYDLLGGYRGLYNGAAQPIGHETFTTHGGNGYVYRPVYGAQPFYNVQHFRSYAVVPYHGYKGRALVIDNPGTPYESRYSPNAQIGGRHAAMIDVMPHYYASAPYGYATQATYAAPAAGEAETAELLPNGDLRLRDGTIVPAEKAKPTKAPEAKAPEVKKPVAKPPKKKSDAAKPKTDSLPEPKKPAPAKREF